MAIIKEYVPLICSLISASFVIIMVIAKFVTWIKLKAIDHKKIKEKQIEEKEKELFIALSKKYGGLDK